MSAQITQETDPILWAALHSSYIAQGEPGMVVRGGVLYAVHTAVSTEIFFIKQNNKDLYDSRSLSNSKPASYNEIDGTS